MPLETATDGAVVHCNGRHRVDFWAYHTTLEAYQKTFLPTLSDKPSPGFSRADVRIENVSMPTPKSKKKSTISLKADITGEFISNCKFFSTFSQKEVDKRIFGEKIYFSNFELQFWYIVL